MVSTRQHPRDFPPPEASPTKGSPRKSSRNSTASPAPGSPTSTSPPSFSLTKRAVSNSAQSKTQSAPPSAWAHTASNLTITWLTISIPLVVWDSLYILLRPHTMAGGALQWPIWKPYEIYASIDHVYGWPGWNDKDGFGGAQGVLNAVEVVLYILYFSILYNRGKPSSGGATAQGGVVSRWFAGGRSIEGKTGNRALVIGFTAAVMTLSKTVLYYFNEYYSGFRNVSHNDWQTLIIFYGIMNGLWVVFPAYMVASFGTDILEALDLATESSPKKNY